jgi:hypothetical protein
MVRAAWNNLSIAELRDLNRHRSGYRFSPLTPEGFYVPAEVKHPRIEELMRKAIGFSQKDSLDPRQGCLCIWAFAGNTDTF